MRYPMSFIQQRLWFLDQLDPGKPTYNMPYATWLDGPLDAEALQRSMDALVARHAVLRTRYAALDGVPEQVVADSWPLPVERIELPAGLDPQESTRQAEAIAHERARQPFDLAAGPLIRATLVPAGPDRHLFVLVMHHSISDGWTMRVVMEELSALYREQTTGVAATLPPLWMDYGDYAVWQRDRMRGAELDRLLGYWREQLRGAPHVHSLPTDRPRPARMSQRGAVASATVGAETTRRLAAIAQGADATLFMVFFAGFVATMARYSGQSDVVAYTQVSGRTHAELEPMVGFFSNNVALRFSLADDPTFSGLLSRVRDATLDAMLYQELPLEKLIAELAPERTLAHAPFAQVEFVHGSLYSPPLEAPGITSRGRMLFTGTAKLDFIMYADTWDDQTTTLTLEYSTDLFDATWAERFARCMATMLEHAAADPGSRVADLPMLSAAEVDALIVGRNQRLPADSGSAEIADVRRELQAATATVIDGRGELPVSEVLDRAARLARTLADHGVGTETLVGLCVGRGTEMLTALLAVWWAGGAYVPLDPAFPQVRLAAMARGADLRIVLATEAHRELAAAVADGATVICVDDPAAMAAAPLEPAVVPEDALAYVIFTSGSTGQPKGVGIDHRAVRNLLTSFRRTIRLGREDRFVTVTTLSFDIALLELLLPLVNGTDLVIATAEEAREADRLRSLIERTGATAMQATPQTWRMLELAGGVPARLRLRMCGGEALASDLAARLIAPGAELWNLYGPTETTVWSAARVVTGGPDAAEIGPPIEHTRVYVLDDRLMPVPVGVIGEVCLAGHGVARGYHRRPGLTARSFRPDPWSDEPGARMYRTGDLGRWREGGGLELIGRNDHQVKIRGFRIECGEIETVLRAHRDVRQAVVVTAMRAGEPALVAYIVPRRGSAVAQPGADLAEELRPHLRATLPEYMIPALVVALPALPLTPNAKVDRSALPAPQWGASASAGSVQPRNPVEATLAGIWSDLLATEAPIGMHDNLFALGGYSLTATRFVARVADTYGVSLPVHHVFAGPTIAQLAEVVAADPAFGLDTGASRHAELDALSDEDLDALLRAALAQRNRRQASAGPADS